MDKIVVFIRELAMCVVELLSSDGLTNEQASPVPTGVGKTIPDNPTGIVHIFGTHKRLPSLVQC
jgi:hypothetical protein